MATFDVTVHRTLREVYRIQAGDEEEALNACWTEGDMVGQEVYSIQLRGISGVFWNE